MMQFLHEIVTTLHARAPLFERKLLANINLSTTFTVPPTHEHFLPLYTVTVGIKLVQSSMTVICCTKRPSLQHIATFDRVWGRPGAGAPRVNQDGRLETTPRYNSMIRTHVYDGWHFRRT